MRRTRCSKTSLLVFGLRSALRFVFCMRGTVASPFRLATQKELSLGYASKILRGQVLPSPIRSSRSGEMGTRYVDDVSGAGVLFEGIEWIVAQLVEHGVVMPEISSCSRVIGLPTD